MKINSTRTQKGISLLELMIAMALGLILLVALATVVIVANRSSKRRTTTELMDETARQIFSRLEADLRQAGYVDPFTDNNTIVESFDLTDSTRMARFVRQNSYLVSESEDQRTLLGKLSQGRMQPIRGCNGPFASDGSCTAVAPTTRQAIRISYQALRLNASNRLSSVSTLTQEQSSQSMAEQGCVNYNATENFPFVTNRYFMKAGDDNLRCDSMRENLTAAEAGVLTEQPLVNGVEEMVFRYLITPDDGTPQADELDFNNIVSGRSVNRYVDAKKVESLPLGWASVVGVEVCVVVAVTPLDGKREFQMATVQPNVPSCLRRDNNDETANSPWVNDIPRPANDVREYRRYVRTIALPNSLYLSNIQL